MMEKDIGTTLKYLQQQSVYKQGQAEIVIAEFDRDKTGVTYESAKKYLNPLCRFMTVERQGIAYARHSAIMASFGSICVCADSDCYFSGNRSIEKLTKPILEGQAVLTGCDNIFQTKGLTEDQLKGIAVPNAVLDTLNQMQRNPLLPIVLEPGMTFSKKAYLFVGGFSDIPMYEGATLGAKLVHAYTPRYKQWIPKVACIVSPRRALGSAVDGILQSYGNYAKAYR